MNGNDIVAGRSCRQLWRLVVACCAILLLPISVTFAQDQNPADPAMQQRIRSLSDTVDRLEAQMQKSQQELADLRQQLSALRDSTGVSSTPAPAETAGAADLAEAVASIRESEGMHDAQIATLEQTKVESASKYPLKLSGMILMTGFVNSKQVDTAATPAIAMGGAGSTGATIQQTIVGLDANGPRVFGARSHADLRFDLNGGAGSGSGTGYKYALVRLRTAHGELTWDGTQAFFSLDRPLLNPDTPTSLTATALPALAWSGNLWAWNPQTGISHDMNSRAAGSFRIQGALIDIANPPPLFPVAQNSTYTPPSTAELSRWPGVEGRVSWEDQRDDNGVRFGISGLFAPHRTATTATRFNSWAGAADLHLPVTRFMQISASAYRGAALGGLGAGTYKDIVARTVQGVLDLHVLDDVGGWVQWKQRPGERLEFNEAFGMDNVPAGQLRPYAVSDPVSYYNLTRNRTVTANVIYSPSAYLLLSLEYRRIASSYVTSPTLFSDVIGIGAGYKF